MKKKRVIIEYVMEIPANQDPFEYISIGGGQLVNIVSNKITKEEDIGDIDTPWGQKMREFNAVKKILGEGARAVLKNDKKWRVAVYGYTGSGDGEDFHYDYSIFNKTKGEDAWNTTDVPINIKSGFTWLSINLRRGILTFYTRSNASPIKTMSVGNPDIVNEITQFLNERIK